MFDMKMRSTTKKESYILITFINIEAIMLPTILENIIPIMYKKIIYHIHLEF